MKKIVEIRLGLTNLVSAGWILPGVEGSTCGWVVNQPLWKYSKNDDEGRFWTILI